tara:strand:+ start:657 stop:848 length:192 start_codon:yes stop_codon:yes gene_type:complete
MSKHIINSMRGLAPYLIEKEEATPSKGLVGRVNSPPDTGKVDPKQSIANYVSIIRKQRKSYGE